MVYQLKKIGTIEAAGGAFSARLLPDYKAALGGLAGFGHVQVLWWASGCDNAPGRQTLICPAPYRGGPDALGCFATRAPARPNPIALSCCELLELDEQAGVLRLGYIDAAPGSPLLDLKPYTPSLDRVERPRLPEWCRGWPNSLEQSADFDWSRVFN